MTTSTALAARIRLHPEEATPAQIAELAGSYLEEVGRRHRVANELAGIADTLEAAAITTLDDAGTVTG